VSVLALAFTWYVYVKHDRILKKYQVKKYEEEERNKKAALIHVEKLMEPNIRGGNNIGSSANRRKPQGSAATHPNTAGRFGAPRCRVGTPPLPRRLRRAA
jgi:hypothetical protein